MDNKCNYCEKDIDFDCFGWGWTEYFFIAVLWHAECFEIYEGVPVA